MSRPLTRLFRRKNSHSYYLRLRKDGKDQWLSLGPDRTEAENRARKLLLENRPLVANETVKVAADRWLKNHVANRRNAQGVALARQRMNDFLIPHLGLLQLRNVKPSHIEAYRRELDQKNLSPQTVQHILADCRCFFRWCVEIAELLDRSPFRGSFMPSQKAIQDHRLKKAGKDDIAYVDRLTDEEVAVLIALPDPYGFILRLALGTGMRWGELRRAQASHLNGKVLLVPHSKSGRSRHVPLSESLSAEIRGRVGLLCAFSSGSSFRKTIRGRTGIDRFHPHMTRHTYACKYLEDGGSLAVLQVLLGHSTVKTTQRYATIADEMVRREVEEVDRLRTLTLVTKEG